MLVAAGVLIFFIGTFDHELWTPDEPRVAAISRELGSGSSLFVTTLNGHNFLEKPPLYYWCAKLSMMLGGETAGWARLPSVLFALGAALFTLLTAARAFGPRAAVAAFFMMLYSAQWIATGHRVIVDTLLALGVTGALYGAQLWLAPRTPRDRNLGALLFHLAAIIGFWSKGPIALVFCYFALFGGALLMKRTRLVTDYRVWLGGLVVAIGAGAWFFALWRVDPSGELVRGTFARNVIDRFFPAEGVVDVGHVDSSPIFYLVSVGKRFLPGSVLLAPAAIFYWEHRPPRSQWAPSAALVVLGLLLLTAAGTKRALYGLPLIAPLAILVAPVTIHGLDGSWPRTGWLLRIAGWLGITAAVIAPIGRLITRGNLPLGAIIVGILALITAVVLVRTRQHAATRWALPAIACLAVYWSGAASLMDVIDDGRSAKAFMEDIRPHLPDGATVAIYDPNETRIALLAFYTRRPVEQIETYAALRERLRDGDAKRIVFGARIERHADLVAAGTRGPIRQVLAGFIEFPDDGPAGQRDVEVLASDRFGRHRCLILVSATD